MDEETELKYLLLKEKYRGNTMRPEAKVFLAFVIYGVTMYLLSFVQ